MLYSTVQLVYVLTTAGTWPGMICCCICWARAFFSARWFLPLISSWSCTHTLSGQWTGALTDTSHSTLLSLRHCEQ